MAVGDILVARQDTLDATKTQADAIKTVVDAINAKPGPFKYTNNATYGKISTGGSTSAYTTMLNITGSGELYAAFLYFSTTGSIPGTGIKITIDGSVVFTYETASGSSSGGANYFTGLVWKDLIYTGNASDMYILGLSSTTITNSGIGGLSSSYPTTDATIGASTTTRKTFVPFPIKFNSSLTIETKGALSTNVFELHYSYSIG